jgi:hypothetical protein
MKYKYTGTDERVFPTLAIIVKSGEEFEAPADFNSANVVPAGAYKPTPTASAPSDLKAGE